MVVAQLLVERGSYADKSEDWGELQFLGLPSPGDRIAVSYEDATQYLTVLCVHHRPVVMGDDDGAGTQPTAPLANVVAKWTGSDQ